MHVFGYAFVAAFVASLIRLLYFSTSAMTRGITSVTNVEACVTMLMTLLLSFAGIILMLLIQNVWESI